MLLLLVPALLMFLQVLLEGREATVNYVPTPFRFTLTMSDTTIIGERRAAQVIGAKALEKCSAKAAAEVAAEEVAQAVVESLAELQQG